MLTKKILNSLIFGSILTGICFAQWQPEVRLTFDQGRSQTHQRSIAAAGNYVIIVWTDNRDGHEEIYAKTSWDEGVTWSQDVRTTNTNRSYNPQVAISGSSVHLVWLSRSSNTSFLVYKRSTNLGIDWSSNITLASTGSYTMATPTISAAGQNVQIAWSTENSDKIYYTVSYNGGSSWTAANALVLNCGSNNYPSLAATGTDVHLAWQYTQLHNNFEIWYKRSSSSGENWGPDVKLIFPSGFYTYQPSITAQGNIVHLVWHDTRDGNSEIYYSRSGNRGVFWSPEVRLTNAPGYSGQPSLVMSDPLVHLVWQDSRNGSLNSGIYYKRKNDATGIWDSDLRLTDRTTEHYPSIAMVNTKLHVTWISGTATQTDIYYKRNPTGNPVGITPVGSEIPLEFNISQNYPNPFNPVTKFDFDLPVTSNISIVIYDITGRILDEYKAEDLSPGKYQHEWNGEKFSSGVYFYKLTANNFSAVKKMSLIK